MQWHLIQWLLAYDRLYNPLVCVCMLTHLQPLQMTYPITCERGVYLKAIGSSDEKYEDTDIMHKVILDSPRSTKEVIPLGRRYPETNMNANWIKRLH